MSKRSLLIEADLQNLEKEVKEYLSVSQKEMEETYQKNAMLMNNKTARGRRTYETTAISNNK